MLGVFSKKYTIKNKAFSESYIEELRKEILNSPFLKKNPLNYRFGSTLGFSVIFKKEKIDQLISRFPYFEKYLESIYQDKTDIYYLNPLVLNNGSEVEPHIDHSLRSYSVKIPFPERVSVLYVKSNNQNQGKLFIYNKKEKIIKKVKPKVNKLIHFQGNLRHAVEKIESDDQQIERVSLVCEQYRVDSPEIKDKVPNFLVRSSANFQTYLEEENK